MSMLCLQLAHFQIIFACSLIVPVNLLVSVFLCHEKMNVTKACRSVKLKLAILEIARSKVL